MAQQKTPHRASKPAPKSSRKPAARKAAAERRSTRNQAIAGVTIVSALLAGVGAAIRFGLLDRFVARRDAAAHPAPDLAAKAPTPGAERAPVDFRPDPTAAVPESEREALRPATGPIPSMVAQRGEMANQTGAANG